MFRLTLESFSDGTNQSREESLPCAHSLTSAKDTGPASADSAPPPPSTVCNWTELREKELICFCKHQHSRGI